MLGLRNAVDTNAPIPPRGCPRGRVLHEVHNSQATSPHGPTYLFQSDGILTPRTNHSLLEKRAWLFITPATVQHILPCLIKSKSFTHQQDFLAGTRADMLLPRSPVASCQLSQNTYVNAMRHQLAPIKAMRIR